MDEICSLDMEAEYVARAVGGYSAARPKFEDLCSDIKRILVTSFMDDSVPYHTIEARAKSIASFERKASRLNDVGRRKYEDPLKEITDLAGIRIITYTLRDVERVCNFINCNFNVLERRDVGEERFKEGKFGYKSIHFLVKYRDERTILPDFTRFTNMICEIQVRTVLQHAWAEIEHDIQYKNQSGLPTLLQRRFTALAGLLEIADREFQAIQDEDERLKATISEALQEELTKTAIADSAADIDTGYEGRESSEDKNVRQLVRMGHYTEAIELYNSKISLSPTMHTLYLGRAKVKFLSGDRAGALEDIDAALDLKLNDPAALKLLEQVKEGGAALPRSVSSDANELSRKGNEFLEAGDGVAAFEYYSLAQQNGASRPFSLVNKSMACFLAGDYDGSKSFLSYLDIRPGTPMAANIVAMYCMIYALSSPEKYVSEMEKLRETVGACDPYLFNLSPLAKLQRGINNWARSLTPECQERVSEIFGVLSGGNS